MANGVVGVLLLGVQQLHEEDEWAGTRDWDPSKIKHRNRLLAERRERSPDDLPEWEQRELEIDLARAAEKPAFYGLTEPPPGEIRQVDISPSVQRNIVVEEMERINRTPDA